MLKKQLKFLNRMLAAAVSLAVLLTSVVVVDVLSTQASPSSEDEIYPFYRYIDYSKYQVSTTSNSWLDEDSGTPYWTKMTDDATADGGAYMRYNSVGIKVGTVWEGNHTLAPSESGSTSDIILPAATTFRATLCVRAVDLSNASDGLQPFVIYGSKISAATSSNTESQKYTVTDKSAYITADYTEWTEISFIFTTPDEYLVKGSETFNKCYIGFYPGAEVAYSYDIDSLKLVAINNADTRVVDFSDYVPKLTTNAWGPAPDRSTNPTTLWTSVVKDSSALGGAYLNFDGYTLTDGIGLENWYGHFNLILSNDGTYSTTGDMTDINNIVLPTSTTYRFKVRLRLNEVSGNTKLYITYSTNRNNCNVETVIAENLQVGDWTEYSLIFTTPEEYTSTYQNFYFGVTNKAAGDLNYDLDYAVLEKVDTVTITFNANGGSFSGSDTADELQVIGEAPEVRTDLTAPDTRSALAGWATSADSTELVTEITEDMAGTILYAVWVKDPHLGGYNNQSIQITFDGYSVENGGSYSAGGVYYWTPVTDETSEDGNILRYRLLTGNEGSWHGNYAMALSTDGTPAVLPNGVTYKATVRVRTQSGIPSGGVYPFIAYSDRVGRGYNSYPDESCFTLYTDAALKDTNKEWCEITFNFTTPEEYKTVTDVGLFNKCYFGFYASGLTTDFCYDIDTITLTPVSNTAFYIDSDSDGKYELYSQVSGVPGTALPLPSATETKEVYNSDGTGYVETYSFENWYADEDCTKAAILKFGNFDVDLYCKAKVTASSYEGQVGFAGFDTYTEQAEGMSYDANKSALSTEQSFVGTASMKTELSAGDTAAFELKNAYAIEAKNGKTYKITLSYMSSAAVNIGVGIGDAGAIPDTAYALSTETVAADSKWNTLSFLMNTDYTAELARGYAPAVVITSQTEATVYIDNVTISAVTDAIGVESALSGDSEDVRFMMSYNCGGDNTVVIEEKEYTVTEHGVLVTGADNKAPLTLENAGKYGVFKVSQTDTAKYFNRNAATYTTVYSVLLEGLPLDDGYDISAKGYVKLSNGEIYYSDTITASAADADDKYADTFNASDLIPDSAYTSYDESTDTHVFVGGRDGNDENWDNSFFLCLPAGTVISSEQSIRVDLYYDNLKWKAGTASTTGYTLPSASYVKLEITGADFDAVSIDVPPEYRSEVYSGSRVDLFETLMKNNIEYVSNQINNASEDAVNYIFITDLHTGAYIVNSSSGGRDYEASAAVQFREDTLAEQMKSLVELANTNRNIDFIVIGGDIVNGYETPNSPLYKEALAAGKVSNVREFVISQMQAVLNPLKESTKPVFILRGNHDDNHMQGSYYTPNGYSVSIVPSEVVSDRDWNNGIIKEYLPEDIVRDSTYLDAYTGEEISGYYYYDLVKNGETTRIICLDVFDHRYAYNEEGEITALTSANGSTGTIGYNKQQLNWLVNVALKDFDGNVLFFSHAGVDSETAGSILNGAQLREILAAYQNKSSYSNDTLGISADYSDRGSGSIMSFQFGHMHSEALYYAPDMDVWQIASATASVQGGNGSTDSPNVNWSSLYRAYRTEFEACYDVMSASPEVVYKYNIGAGYDGKLLYPELP